MNCGPKVPYHQLYNMNMVGLVGDDHIRLSVRPVQTKAEPLAV